jgi:hypothetical protein
MTALFILVGLLWLLCAALTYGMEFADFEATCIHNTSRLNAGFILGLTIVTLPFAPIITFVSFCLTGFAEHGLRYRFDRSEPK